MDEEKETQTDADLFIILANGMHLSMGISSASATQHALAAGNPAMLFAELRGEEGTQPGLHPKTERAESRLVSCFCYHILLKRN